MVQDEHPAHSHASTSDSMWKTTDSLPTTTACSPAQYRVGKDGIPCTRTQRAVNLSSCLNLWADTLHYVHLVWSTLTTGDSFMLPVAVSIRNLHTNISQHTDFSFHIINNHFILQKTKTKSIKDSNI